MSRFVTESKMRWRIKVCHNLGTGTTKPRRLNREVSHFSGEHLDFSEAWSIGLKGKFRDNNKTDEPETKGEAFGSQRVISPRAERSCAPDVCSTTNSVQCRENIQLSEASKI